VVVLVLLNSQRRLQREIQRRIVAEEEVRALAFHDSLTGLPNRNSFIPYATQKLLTAKRNGERLALCYLDLNKFKEINDSYGHQAGDAILVHAAHAISANIREADMAARMGGDEFVVLLDGVHDADDIYRLTEQICQAIAKPLHWQGRELCVSASLGVAIYPQAGEHLDELMSKADSAMFYKKAAMLALR
jgi:diguanylate cyclase (GGDEF)-like protein